MVHSGYLLGFKPIAGKHLLTKQDRFWILDCWWIVGFFPRLFTLLPLFHSPTIINRQCKPNRWFTSWSDDYWLIIKHCRSAYHCEPLTCRSIQLTFSRLRSLCSHQHSRVLQLTVPARQARCVIFGPLSVLPQRKQGKFATCQHPTCQHVATMLGICWYQ